MNIFIFHGVEGHSGENWFPWLKKELENAGHHVIVPDFPNADQPTLEEWMRHFRKFQTSVTEESVFIGHSLGSAFALRLLEQLDHPIAAAFLVASVWGTMDNEFDPVMTSFTREPYDWTKIRKNCRNFTVIHSNDDPYIKLKLAEDLAKYLGTTVTLVKEGGHFNEAAGFTAFPLLLKEIRRTLR